MTVVVALSVLFLQVQNTVAEQALIKAVREGSVEAVVRALARGASVDTREVKRTMPSLSENSEGGKPYFGEPVLTIAIERSDVSLAKLLLSKGANPNLKDEAGWTPLMHASRSEQAFISMLIQSKAKVNEVNRYGETALAYACNFGPLENVRLLLEAGADPKVGSALKSAIDSHESRAVELLLKHGADPNRVFYGYTSYEHALLVDPAIAEMLSKAGRRGRPMGELKALQEAQRKKWSAEFAAKKKQEELKAASTISSRVTQDDRVLLKLLFKDIAVRKEVKHSARTLKVVCSPQTREATGFEFDDQLNGELDEKAHDVTLTLRKSLQDRNRKSVSLKGVLAGLEFMAPSAPAGERGQLEVLEKGTVWVAPLLPGYSTDGKRAVLRFSFGPTPHGANGTYLLERRHSGWVIVWRDFAFYA